MSFNETKLISNLEITAIPLEPCVPPSPIGLTSGKILAVNSAWNLAGLGLPMIAALFAIPLLIKGIGLDRFGVLTLGWVVVGYFGLFDLGLGRALTKMVADRIASGKEADLNPLIWSSSFLLLLLGVVATVIMSVFSPLLVREVLNVPVNLQGETIRALYLLAFSVPIVTTTSGFRGVLEALQHFHTVNIIRVPMAIVVFAGPLLVLPFTRSLVWIFAVLVASRTGACIAYLNACLKAVPSLRHRFQLRWSCLKPVMQFGGWITVSNVVSPIMVSLDRFIIGALMSLAAVAYYATPFEMVTKLQVVPMALAGVMFPAFSASYIVDRNRTVLLMNRAVKYVSLSAFPVIFLIIAFAPELLKIWLGSAFATYSTSVLRLLGAGVFVNCLGQIAYAMVQGTGRPDVTAKLHLAEFALYVPAVYLATKIYGLEGAATAWSVRVIVDAAVLLAFAYRSLPQGRRAAVRLGVALTAALGVLYGITIPSDIAVRGALVLGVLAALGAATWFLLLAEEERLFVRVLVLRTQKVAV